MGHFILEEHGITVADVRRNLPPAAALRGGDPLRAGRGIADSGALVAYSGDEDRPLAQGQARRPAPGLGGRRLVGAGQHPARRRTAFAINRERADRLPQHARAAVRASTASPAGTRRYRLKVRVICARPYHALFMHNMLIRPTTEELRDVRRARLRDLQRRRSSPPTATPTGMTSQDERRPAASSAASS